MLSICIPHFNFQNAALFYALDKQCKLLAIQYEIIIADDASEEKHKEYLEHFSKMPNFKVIFSDKNRGRSAIRNLLIKESFFNHILFLDGDSVIIKDNFIANYLANCHLANMLVGGRIYPATYKKEQKLHFLYGTKVEQYAQSNFHSNNFLMRKIADEPLKFDEDLSKYGYEDAVFGLSAQQKGYQIIRIKNEIMHGELKSNEVFIKDVEEALENISFIYFHKNTLVEALNLPVLKTCLFLKKAGFHYISNKTAHFMLPFLKNGLVKNKSMMPLSALKIYKIYYLYNLLNRTSLSFKESTNQHLS